MNIFKTFLEAYKTRLTIQPGTHFYYMGKMRKIIKYNRKTVTLEGIGDISMDYVLKNTPNANN